MVLQGDYFGNLLNSTTARSRLVAALIADLSRMFKVDSSRLEIEGLALGSLLVNYSVSQNTSESAAQASSVVTTTTTTLSQSQGQSVMIKTAALYTSVAVPSGVTVPPITVASTAVIYINSAAITTTTTASSGNVSVLSTGSSSGCDTSCRLVVGGAVAFVLVFIGAVIAGLVITSRWKVNDRSDSDVASDIPASQLSSSKLTIPKRQHDDWGDEVEPTVSAPVCMEEA
jgi:hypothetical protein